MDQVDLSILVVGLKACQLQIDPVEVSRANRARLQANIAQIHNFAIAGQVVVGELQCRLGQQHVGKSIFHRKYRLPLQIVILAFGFLGGCAGAVQTPPALLPALEQSRDISRVGVRTGWIVGRQRHVRTTQPEDWILPQPCRDFFRPG